MQIRNNVETIDLIDVTTGTERPMSKNEIIKRIHYLSVLATKSIGSAHTAHNNMIKYYKNALDSFNVPDLEDMYF